MECEALSRRMVDLDKIYAEELAEELAEQHAKARQDSRARKEIEMVQLRREFNEAMRKRKEKREDEVNISFIKSVEEAEATKRNGIQKLEMAYQESVAAAMTAMETEDQAVNEDYEAEMQRWVAV